MRVAADLLFGWAFGLQGPQPFGRVLTPGERRPPRSVFSYLFRQITFRKRRKRRRDHIALGRAMAQIAAFPRNADAPRHGLPGELIISLTSYPGRFDSLHLTLMSLLDQTVKADRILLWIAHDDAALLPDAVKALVGDRLEIRTCEDLRNFKKILPALRAHPDAFITICDDDSYYPPDWLAGIVSHYDADNPSIVCTRAHQWKSDRDGMPVPYEKWPRNVAAPWTAQPRHDLLPTGNGGVLYPPGALPADTLNDDLRQKLCATSDDVWLFFMSRKGGFPVRRVPGKKRHYLEWPHSQAQALWSFHRWGKKDEHLRDMARHFGTP